VGEGEAVREFRADAVKLLEALEVWVGTAVDATAVGVCVRDAVTDTE
jgi:hypothetical protein